jgi:hypothetical protein
MGWWMWILNPFQMSKILRNKKCIRKSILMVPRRYFNLDISSSTICHLIQKVIKWKRFLRYILQAFFFLPKCQCLLLSSASCVVLDPCKGSLDTSSFQFKFFFFKKLQKPSWSKKTAQISKGGGGGIWSQNATMNYGYKR